MYISFRGVLQPKFYFDDDDDDNDNDDDDDDGWSHYFH